MNQGHEIRSFALNKEAKKGQGLKGSAAHHYPNFHWMPPNADQSLNISAIEPKQIFVSRILTVAFQAPDCWPNFVTKKLGKTNEMVKETQFSITEGWE